MFRVELDAHVARRSLMNVHVTLAVTETPMRPTFIVLAGLLLASPVTAAYGPVTETLPETTPTVAEASPSCTATRNGFLSLREHIAARQPDAARRMVVNAADSPAQLILVIGFLHKQNQTVFRESVLAPHPPMQAVIAFSVTFLQGLSEMEDHAAVAVALTVMEAKGVCAHG